MLSVIAVMKRAWRRWGWRMLVGVMGLLSGINAQAEQTAPPRMLVAGMGVGAVLVENGMVTKRYPTQGACQDAWKLSDGRVVAVGTQSLQGFDAAGQVLQSYRAAAGVELHNCQPLPDGGVLLAECGTKRLLELNADLVIVREVKLDMIREEKGHGQVRHVRKTGAGDYWVMASYDGKAFRINSQGVVQREVDLRQLPAPVTGKIGHSVVPLKNGNVLIGTSYGACLVELDPAGKIVWTLTPQDVPEIGLKYVAGVHRLPNGNTVISAYNSDYPLFEVTPAKTVVWKLAKNPALGTPTNVQVLDVAGDPSQFGLEK